MIVPVVCLLVVFFFPIEFLWHGWDGMDGIAWHGTFREGKVKQNDPSALHLHLSMFAFHMYPVLLFLLLLL